MPVSERAKQFSPFSALRGLEDALARKEAELLYEEKKLLSDDVIASINRVLCRVDEGMTVRVMYYDERVRRYMTVRGTVEVHDRLYGTLRVGGEIIMYDEISGIEILGQQRYDICDDCTSCKR